MEQKEQNLWKLVDVGGYAAYGTLFAFTLESIKTKVESDELDMQEQQDRIKTSFENIFNRFQKIDLSLLDKKFPLATLRELKEKVFPEMGLKYKELNTLLKHFISGSSHLKIRIINKINECKKIIKQMNDLGIEFSKSERYWEYRKPNPDRIYLEDNLSK